MLARRLLPLVLAGSLIAPALPARADDPPPARVLIAADGVFGEAQRATFRVVVSPVGASALDQATLDVQVRAVQADAAWRFLITGEATEPDGVTRRPIAISTDSQLTRAVDASGQRVLEATGGAAMSLLNEQGVFPAIFWVVLWDGLISQQLEDAGTDLPMAYAGSRLVDGRECQVVRVDYTRQRAELGGVYDVWWFIDAATNLPARIEACYFRRDQNAYGFITLAISQMAINPDLSDADLTLQVPAGYAIEPYALPDLGGADGGEMAGPALGALAPDWTLSDATGAQHSLVDYRGSVVVMDFWATWCQPCQMAMPGLQALHEEFKDSPVRILGMNLWESENPVEFMRLNGYTYGLMLQADPVGEAYSVDGIPAIYAVGPDGKVIFRAGGYSPDLEANLRAAIQRALPATTERGPSPPTTAPSTTPGR